VILVTIGNVDKYGYCGRDWHPQTTDEGVTGVLIGALVETSETSFSDGVTDVNVDRWKRLKEVLDERARLRVIPGQPHDAAGRASRRAGSRRGPQRRWSQYSDAPMTVLMVKLPDGRRVDLVEHEIAKIEVVLE
jgi:hypothetical protein